MKTFSAKASDVERTWHVIDASVIPLGRLSTVAATLLMGKHKPMFTKHVDCGDFVIVINANELVVTGAKRTDKIYYKYSGYPGGMKSSTLNELMAKDVTAPITKAIRGMLPVNKLRDERLKRLKVYGGSEHNHAPQKPVIFNIKEAK
jgi:large subunit ribosomal protein L13